MRVLYVEDARSDADLTLREMRDTAPDVRMDVVGSVAEALARLDDVQKAVGRREDPGYDLVLLDVSLPDGSGLSVLAELRHRALPLAVVVLTGSGDEQTVLAALRAGADDYLPKRHEYWTVLLPTLRAALSRFRSQAIRRAQAINLLYAEPNEHDVALTRMHLATYAPFIRLEIVHTADEVLARLPKSGATAGIDVVLLDYRLPGMNALEALKEIIEARGLDVPVIITTGHGDEDVALQALKLGAADYIVKSAGYLNHLPATIENSFNRALATRERLALRDSETRFRAFQEASPAAARIVDAAGRITYANRVYLENLGLSAEHVIGKSLSDVFPDQYARAFLSANERVLNSGKIDASEETLPFADGRLHTMTVYRFPIEDAHGARAVGSVAIDITERRNAEEDVRDTRNFLASIFDNIPNSIFVKDVRDLRFVRANAACERMTGFSEKELLGKNDYDFFPREQADFFVAKDRETISNNQRVFIVEEEITSKDGTTRILRTKKFPISDQNGQPKYLLGMSEDITEQKRAEKQLRESEAKYRGLIEQASDGIFISDPAGNFVLVNSRGCELLGYEEHELLGMNGSATYLEEERELHGERMRQVGAGAVLRFERMIRRKDGTAFPAEVSVKMIDSGLVQVMFRDISERRSQEQRIARLNRIQAVLSSINSAIVRIRDRQELFDEACHIATKHGAFPIAWIAMFAESTGNLEPVAFAGFETGFFAKPAGENPKVALAPNGVGMKAFSEVRTVIDNDIASMPDLDLIRREAIGHGCRAVIGLPLSTEGKAVGALMLYAAEKDFFDEEEVKLLEELAGDVSFALSFIAQQERVEYLAYYDTLTGLPNRSLFFDRLTHQLGTATREGTEVALILMDLDRFRLVNDTLGRQAGDALIRAVAQRIKDTVRSGDTVSRVGADSFAIAVSGNWAAPDAAHVLESRNQRLFGKPFLLGAEELRVSATSGIALFPGDGGNPEVLFANAEAALRKAKEQSARFLFYGPEMNARVADSLRLENRLRQALENGEMVLWYQPKVSSITRKLTGFEALMRWRDPETGMVPPARFIPLMEQTGLILEAGIWALSQVARDCRLWRSLGLKPPRVAVNVSPLQLRQKDFVSTVIEAADAAESAGGSLDLEITESVIMENVDAVISKLQTIRGLGVRIYIDDFGTGYSSLAYVARLPIHSLKIDRSFVVGMTESEENMNIVNSVISLAHTMKLLVVAEGVETDEQAALLERLECDELQGYLVSKPVPPEEVPALAAKLT